MDFTKINGYEFEDYVSNILKNMGFEVEQTTYSNDGGIDIIAVCNKPIFSGKYIIQCKNWQGNVGAPEIRDLYGVVMDQRANKGILITPSDFTEQAYEFAKGKNIELINGTGLRQLSNSNETSDEKQKNIFPNDFNRERYNYLLNQINDNRKISTYYTDMENFLFSYILSKKYNEYSKTILEMYIKHKKDKIKYCYSTKSNLNAKICEEKNLVTYYLLVGKIDKAVEIFLASVKPPFKFDKKMPAIINNKYSQQVVTNYTADCLVRNLYVLFTELRYANGLKFIEHCQEWNYKYEDLISFGMKCHLNNKDINKELQKINNDFENYNNWDGFTVIYIPEFYLWNKKNSYQEDVKIKAYIQVQKIKETLAKIDLKNMCDKIDKTFRTHGYDFVN